MTRDPSDESSQLQDCADRSPSPGHHRPIALSCVYSCSSPRPCVNRDQSLQPDKTALMCSDVGSVNSIHLIALCHSKLAFHQIVEHRLLVVAACCHLVFLAVVNLNTSLPHQLSRPVATHTQYLTLQADWIGILMPGDKDVLHFFSALRVLQVFY